MLIVACLCLTNAAQAEESADEAKAAEAAAAAKLTPIVPSPGDPSQPAFQLYAEFDIPVLSIGLVFAGARLIRSQSAYCAPLCERGPLNALDELSAGAWSPRWRRASDVGLYTLMLGSVTMLLVDEGPLRGLNDMVVIAESALAATALASILTLAASRPRPFVYGEKAPLSERESADGSLSFLSSHAAVAFAIVTSSYMTSRRLHPRNNASMLVLGVGGALAAFVTAARVFAGMHFITDAVGGAVVGASMGVLVPALHGSPVSVVPVVGATEKGLGFVAQF